jgi:hypothetical protein
MKTILCYGDSNTHGTRPIDFDLLETSFVPSNYRYPKAKRWTGVLQERLGNGFWVIEEGLNSRTTVFDDPIEGIHKNGLTYLCPCLESHAPVDIVIMMLGTNDLKTKFSVSAYDISMGIGVLIDIIQKSATGPDGKKPDILVMCPPPLGKLSYLKGLFGKEGIEKSQELSMFYEKICKLYECYFLDVGKIIKTSPVDGIHYEPQELEMLGTKVASNVLKILGQ